MRTNNTIAHNVTALNDKYISIESNDGIIVMSNNEAIKQGYCDTTYGTDRNVIYMNGSISTNETHSAYLDRMQIWNSKKYNKASKLLDNYISRCSLETIEKFLSCYFEDKVRLIKMIKEVSSANGYDYFCFVFTFTRDIKSKEQEK